MDQVDEERARLEAENAALRQELHAHRMESTGALAAGVAHDMNNVLAAIMGFCEVVLDQTESAPLRRDLEEIVKQAERGAHLTRSLLAFSRKGQYRRQVVAFDALIRRAQPLLAQVVPQTIQLRTSYAAPAAHIEGDPVQLSQVLVNLVVNAVDAMGGTGCIEIATDVVAAGARLRVTDTGCGMDDMTRRRVFEPFFTTKPTGQGTGLGLSFVWGVVHAHAGSITVESEPGRGTAFTIHVPLTEAAPKVEARPQRTDGDAKRTILVVDDEDAVRECVARMLTRMGFEVVCARDGVEGLRELAAHAIDVVVLDMAMPNMGGAEMFARLRAFSQVPVLLATGYAIDGEVQRMVAQGAELLEKPFSSAELLVRVTKLLASRPARATAV